MSPPGDLMPGLEFRVLGFRVQGLGVETLNTEP